MLLFCCINIVAIAEDSKEIELIQSKNEIHPLSMVDEPTAYQQDVSISIQLSDASSYVTVRIVNNETGMQAYSMVYSGTSNILINLENEPEGIYTLYVQIEGTEYSGYFTL